ncbi:hypothetical protein QR685DRAFT_184548 [Neurospora intermedia]|uniref:Secreted protein n=1 Tax=Neurospora intermedia TaxID=5142 RepID=A0ABR3DM64_NEUIN
MCIARATRHGLVDCVFVCFIPFLLGCSVGYQRRHEVSVTQDIGTNSDFPIFCCFFFFSFRGSMYGARGSSA